MQARHEERHIGQWNRTESQVANPNIYHQLIFDEGDKKIEWEKNSLFNQLCWTGYLHTKKYYAGLLLHIVYEN